MKRHPALIGLSHDHHEILLLARLLRRQGATSSGVRPLDAAEQCRIAQQFLAGLCAHFRVEEGALQLAVHGGDRRLSELVRAVCSAHRRLEQAIAGLHCSTATDVAMRELGNHLYDYVRDQERRVFPELQRILNEPDLAAVAAYLTRQRDPTACRAHWS